MLRYDPARHHRRSIRLRGYDYRQPGAYFVTMCVQDRARLFGHVTPDGRMHLTAAGQLVADAWRALPRHYSHVRLDAFVVMPNHVHGVIVLVDDRAGMAGDADTGNTGIIAHVGAGLRPAPTGPATDGMVPPADRPIPPPQRVVPDGERMPGAVNPAPQPARNANTRAPLSEIVRAFKSFSARAVNAHRATPGVAVWQRNYYEHVVRTPDALRRIRAYIDTNPRRWAHDALHPAAPYSPRIARLGSGPTIRTHETAEREPGGLTL